MGEICLHVVKDPSARPVTNLTRSIKHLASLPQILQSIGNLRNEVEAKEQFLSPMLPVLQQGVVDVKKFISAIIDVEDSTVSNSRLSRAS